MAGRGAGWHSDAWGLDRVDADRSHKTAAELKRRRLNVEIERAALEQRRAKSSETEEAEAEGESC